MLIIHQFGYKRVHDTEKTGDGPGIDLSPVSLSGFFDKGGCVREKDREV